MSYGIPCAIKLYAAFNVGGRESPRLDLRLIVLFAAAGHLDKTYPWVISRFGNVCWIHDEKELGHFLGVVENRKQGEALLPAPMKVRDVPGQTFIDGTKPPV